MSHVRYLPVVALVAASSAMAQAPTMRAEFATQGESREVIVDGRLWSCSGTACVARGTDPRPAVACRKLARKLGSVTRFSTPSGELDAAALAQCNRDRE